jgi:hypothetical protein
MRSGVVDVQCTSRDAIDHPSSEYEQKVGSAKAFDSFLQLGRSKKVCVACGRPMEREDLERFEIYVRIVTSFLQDFKEQMSSPYLFLVESKN